MKKLLIFLSFVLLLCGCQSRRSLKGISETLEVDVSKGKIVVNEDDHGGFHGDGQTYMEIALKDEEVKNAIMDSPAWKFLPLSEPVQNLMDRGFAINSEVTPSLYDEQGNLFFSQIKNGYYCFVNRESKIENRKDESELIKQGSRNFSLAFFDADTSLLYYYELDM